MANVNAAMLVRLRAAGANVTVLNTAAASLDRRWWQRIGRFPAVAAAILRLCSVPADAVYMSVSGGPGQCYEMLMAWLARRRGMSLTLHHHSFAYIDRYSRLTAWLIRAAGPDALHLTLCSCMADALAGLYPRAARLAALSNAAVLGTDGAAPSMRSALRAVGLLGNLSRDKGVFDALDLAAGLADSESPVELVLAGPFEDAATEAAVRDRCAQLSGVVLLGPVYGADKERFFSRIDALLFPSRYRNEAEPLTIHEAMARGIPVIASDRGCIAEIVGDDAGRVVPIEQFVQAAHALIVDWSGAPANLAAASAAAHRRFTARCSADTATLDSLLVSRFGGVKAFAG